jgi:hypothetical protein
VACDERHVYVPLLSFRKTDVFNRFIHVLRTGVVIAAALAFPATARAEDVRTVLELFTSQGCSSCPPADKLAAVMAKDPGLLVLSLPVNYWDYLGWKDTLAHSAFSVRQKGYAKSRGDRQVYTPQIVINGMHHALGSDREGIEAGAIAAGNLRIALRIESKDGSVAVILPRSNVAVRAMVLVMPVLREHRVTIERGENRGETVAYHNIVRGISEIGRWNGDESRFPLPAEMLKGEAGDADAFAVIVQEVDGKYPGAILAAARSPGF